MAFARQAGQQILFDYERVKGLKSNALHGDYEPIEAARRLVEGTGLQVTEQADGVLVVELATTGRSASGSDETLLVERLEEVVVTASKREERLIDVPIAISAFSSTAMDTAGAAQLSDFLASAPGVSIVDGGNGGQEIAIRGISSTFGDAPVGFYLDELPFSFIGNTAVPDVRTYDLERVEVLRGPQGTLYGDGSLGGTVRVLTKDPDLRRLQAGVDAGIFGTQDGEESYSAKAMLNLPLSQDAAALRLVASQEDFGGWIDDAVTGEKDRNDRTVDNYRAKLRFAPLEKLDLVLSAWHTREDADDSQRSLQNRTSSIPPTSSFLEYDLYSVTMRYRFDAVDVVSATSLMDFRAGDASITAGMPVVFDQGQDVVSEELRATSRGEGPLRWTGGVFYRKIERDLTGQVGPLVYDQFSDTRSFAIFGEATREFFGGKLDATLGVRYFKDDRSRADGVSPEIIALVQTIDPTFTGEVESSFETVNPKFNIAFHPHEGWMLYTNVAKGFRSGQVQPIVSLITAVVQGRDIPIGINEESLWSYEIGAKGQLAGGRLVLEAAAYYNDWQDLQLAVVVDPVTNLQALANGGAAGVKGLEVSGTFRPINGLNLRLAGSYVDARYRENVPGSNVRKGDRVSGVPDLTVSTSAEYRWPLTDRFNGFLYSSAQYTSERVDVVNFARPSDNTLEVDMRVGLEGTAWGLYLVGNNLTDEDGAVSPRSPFSLGHFSRLRPRSYGLNVRYNFN